MTAVITGLGGIVQRIQIAKDTATVRRYHISYAYEQTSMQRLKIETSYRDVIDPSTVIVAHGIRTYTISALASQKLAAMDDRDGRIVPRDLEDIRFLTERHGMALDAPLRRSIADLVSDGGVALADKYRLAYASAVEYTVDDLTATICSLLEYRERIV